MSAIEHTIWNTHKTQWTDHADNTNYNNIISNDCTDSCKEKAFQQNCYSMFVI